jgi:hypothetical protein
MNRRRGEKKMKKVSSMIKGLVVLGITLSFIGVNSVSATRAITDRGTGCYVRVGTGDNDYAYDATCTAHDVIKFDNKGNFQFYEYQDHGELPEGSWIPTKTYRNTFEVCYNLGFAVVCGTATETVTPSGEYKSSFKSH